MGKEKGIGPTDGAESLCFHAEVIDLSAYRSRRSSAKTLSALYLTEKSPWTEALSSCPWLSVKNVNSPAELKANLLRSTPEFIFVDDRLGWIDPISAIELLSSLMSSPIIMVCEGSRADTDPKRVKEAFAAGVHDALFRPTPRAELLETLDLLRKLSPQVSHQ